MPSAGLNTGSTSSGNCWSAAPHCLLAGQQIIVGSIYGSQPDAEGVGGYRANLAGSSCAVKGCRIGIERIGDVGRVLLRDLDLSEDESRSLLMYWTICLFLCECAGV